MQTPEKYRPACALNCLLTNDLILLCVKIEDNAYQDLIFDFTTKTLDLEMPWGISRLLFCINYHTRTYLFKKIEISRHSASDCMYIPSCSENNDRRNIERGYLSLFSWMWWSCFLSVSFLYCTLPFKLFSQRSKVVTQIQTGRRCSAVTTSVASGRCSPFFWVGPLFSMKCTFIQLI